MQKRSLITKHLGLIIAFSAVIAASAQFLSPWLSLAITVLSVFLGLVNDHLSHRRELRFESDLYKAKQNIEAIPDPRTVVTPGITGQGELATINYAELKLRLEKDYPNLKPNSQQTR